MKLLKYGLVTDAVDLVKVLQSVLSAEIAVSKQRLEAEEIGIQAIDDFVNQALRQLDKKEAMLNSNCTNVTDTRHLIIKDFMSTHFSSTKKNCGECGAPSRVVRQEYNSCVFLKALSLKDAKKWAALRRARGYLEEGNTNGCENTENYIGV